VQIIRAHRLIRIDSTKAIIGPPQRKTDIHIRIDSDVFDWFKRSGSGYQIRMNSVLRAFFESRRKLDAGNRPRANSKRSRRAARV